MSALGQKQTFEAFIAMSALPPKADIAERQVDVRFVLKTDIHDSLDHLVGGGQHRLRNCQAQGFGGFEVDGELGFRGLVDR